MRFWKYWSSILEKVGGFIRPTSSARRLFGLSKLFATGALIVTTLNCGISYLRLLDRAATTARQEVFRMAMDPATRCYFLQRIDSRVTLDGIKATVAEAKVYDESVPRDQAKATFRQAMGDAMCVWESYKSLRRNYDQIRDENFFESYVLGAFGLAQLAQHKVPNSSTDFLVKSEARRRMEAAWAEFDRLGTEKRSLCAR